MTFDRKRKNQRHTQYLERKRNRLDDACGMIMYHAERKQDFLFLSRARRKRALRESIQEMAKYLHMIEKNPDSSPPRWDWRDISSPYSPPYRILERTLDRITKRIPLFVHPNSAWSCPKFLPFLSNSFPGVAWTNSKCDLPSYDTYDMPPISDESESGYDPISSLTPLADVPTRGDC